MNRQDIANQVFTTLGDYVGDYDIDAIVDDLVTAHDSDLNDIDDIDTTTYWETVERHDTTTEAEPTTTA